MKQPRLHSTSSISVVVNTCLIFGTTSSWQSRNEARKKLNLSVALQTIPDVAISAYLDAILNGLEIFKLNHSDGNLSGPNPDPTSHRSSHIESPTTHVEGKNERTLTIIGTNAGIISWVLIVCRVGPFSSFYHQIHVEYSRPVLTIRSVSLFLNGRLKKTQEKKILVIKVSERNLALCLNGSEREFY